MNRTRFASALATAALAAILLPAFLHAQVTFQRTYGGTDDDYGYSVRQTADGGCIIVGYTNSFGAGADDVYLIRTDAEGDTLWTRTYGGADYDDGHQVQQTTDGGYIVAAVTCSFGVGVYLIKTDSNGDTLWTRTFGGAGNDSAHSVQQTTDSGYVIAGVTDSYGAGDDDVYLIKTNVAGDTLWTRTFGGMLEDWGNSVQQTADGGYIIAGYTASFGAGLGDVYLIRTDPSGDTLWTRTFGGAEDDSACSVQQTADGGYIIAGCTRSFGAGRIDVYLIRTDAEGDTLWTRTYGGTGWDLGYSVQQTADGGYIIAGETDSRGAGQNDVYLIKTDAAGDTLWTRTFGGTREDWGCSAQQTADGGYIIAGYTWSFGAGQGDVYLIKTDADGHVAVAESKPTPPRSSTLVLASEPNPCRGATTIRTSYIVPRSSLSVYDAQGCLVHSVLGIGNSSFPLDLRALPSGAYFLRLDAAGERATTRVVLQR